LVIGMHIIIGMPLQLIIIGMPMPIMLIMRVQHSFIMSMDMPAMGFMVQTMPSAVISQVMVQPITGIIIGIMLFIMPFIMPMPPIIGICIIGIMFMGIMPGIWFIIGIIWAAGICMAVIMIVIPRVVGGMCARRVRWGNHAPRRRCPQPLRFDRGCFPPISRMGVRWGRLGCAFRAMLW
jgi:hypothetical protein